MCTDWDEIWHVRSWVHSLVWNLALSGKWMDTGATILENLVNIAVF